MRLIRLLKNDLARESSDWVEQGLISQQQAEKICDNYGVDYHQAQASSFGYSVLTGLGFLFIGLALIVLIGANWEEIPRFARMSGLILLTLVTQSYGIYKWQHDTSSATGTFFLGNLFFGAAIILIAQTYHLGEHMPDGVYWWALGCLPFALLTRSILLMEQSLLLSLIWLFLEASEGYLTLGFAPFAFASVWVLYKGKSSLSLFITTVFSFGLWIEFLLAYFWSDQYQMEWHPELFLIAAVLFLLLWLSGHWLALQDSIKAKDYGAALGAWCLRFTLFTLLVLSFDGVWQSFAEENWSNLPSALLFVGLLMVPGILLAIKVKRLGLTIAVMAFISTTMVAVLYGSDSQVVGLQIADNILLIAFGTGLLLRGIKMGFSHYFYLGITTILLTAFLRYIDLIGDYIGGSLLFLVFAGLLLGAAKYWKHHQQLANSRGVSHD
ncbi:DUF2157 domain-containing protein [Endozoicomonas sp. OPT23]|uniref:DUF2157 domain-containing protein n=1 Tax=Endozoicomonas sp. OPT23 TaxID=2072845 RepID=UPI00129B93F3|nr:DUF2157 domain-containing protein [Endozoicomonas sp. OPT23]MRI33034.1 DUF2157 domain-containing protein [Endozoicomonas sp. OPT23]